MGLRLLHLSGAAGRDRRRCLANSEARLVKRFRSLAAALVATRIGAQLELCTHGFYALTHFSSLYCRFAKQFTCRTVASLASASTRGSSRSILFRIEWQRWQGPRPVTVTMTSATDWDQNGNEDLERTLQRAERSGGDSDGVGPLISKSCRMDAGKCRMRERNALPSSRLRVRSASVSKRKSVLISEPSASSPRPTEALNDMHIWRAVKGANARRHFLMDTSHEMRRHFSHTSLSLARLIIAICAAMIADAARREHMREHTRKAQIIMCFREQKAHV